MTTTTSTLNIRMSDEIKRDLESLAQATGRSKNYHVIEAIEQYLAEQSWQIEQIKAGIEDLDAGRFVTHEQVAEDMRRITREARQARETGA